MNPIIDEEGNKFWYSETEGEETLLHRDDGPAVEMVDGSVEWWKHGQLHRIDGPAVENVDGREWWFRGKLVDAYSLDEFKKHIAYLKRSTMKAFW